MSGGIGGDRQMSGKGLNMSNNDLLPRGGCVGKYMVDNKTCLNLSDQRGMRGKVWALYDAAGFMNKTCLNLSNLCRVRPDNNKLIILIKNYH